MWIRVTNYFQFAKDTHEFSHLNHICTQKYPETAVLLNSTVFYHLLRGLGRLNRGGDQLHFTGWLAGCLPAPPVERPATADITTTAGGGHWRSLAAVGGRWTCGRTYHSNVLNGELGVAQRQYDMRQPAVARA